MGTLSQNPEFPNTRLHSNHINQEHVYPETNIAGYD
jgi:hypothetical protein